MSVVFAGFEKKMERERLEAESLIMKVQSLSVPFSDLFLGIR